MPKVTSNAEQNSIFIDDLFLEERRKILTMWRQEKFTCHGRKFEENLHITGDIYIHVEIHTI